MCREFRETLAPTSPDLLWEMIKVFAQRMMVVEMEELRGAACEAVNPDRVSFP